MKKQFDKKRRNPQRSWTIKDMDLLRSQKILVQKCFNWNFQKNGWFITFSMRTCWFDVWSQSSKDNIRNQYLCQRLLIKKRNIKLKKYRSTGNKIKGHNIWCTGKAMEMNMTNGSQNQGYLMQKRQLKTIRWDVQVEIYKKGG